MALPQGSRGVTFPAASTGFVTIRGIQSCSGPVPTSDDSAPPPVVTALAGSISRVTPVYTSGAATQSTITIQVEINNDLGRVVGGIRVDWGDSTVETFSRGYGVTAPQARLLTHVYSTSSATITVTALDYLGVDLNSNTYTLSSTAASNLWCVDQVRILAGIHGGLLSPVRDWVDISELGEFYDHLDRFQGGLYQAQFRRLNIRTDSTSENLLTGVYLPSLPALSPVAPLLPGSPAPPTPVPPVVTLEFSSDPLSNTDINEVITTFTVTQLVGGVPDTSFSGPVTMTVDSGAGTLTGTTVQNAVSGVATFDDLIVINEGGNHVLRATTSTATATVDLTVVPLFLGGYLRISKAHNFEQKTGPTGGALTAHTYGQTGATPLLFGSTEFEQKLILTGRQLTSAPLRASVVSPLLFGSTAFETKVLSPLGGALTPTIYGQSGATLPFGSTEFETKTLLALGGAPPGTPFGRLAITAPLAANGDYFSNADVTDPPGLTTPAVGVWIAPIDVGHGTRRVIANQHNETNDGWWLERISGTLRFLFNSGVPGLIASSSALLDEVDSSTPKWQFVGFKWTSGLLKFYWGLYDATGASSLTIESVIITSTPISYLTGSHFRLGGTAGSFNGMNGNMCEFGYYAASSDADMALLYNGGKGLGYGNIVTVLATQPTVHYVMNDVSGTLIDSTGNHNLARVDAAGTDVIYGASGPNP